MAQSSHLRNKVTGVVFVATEALRRLDTMEACNADGSPYVQFVEELDEIGETPAPEAVTTDPVINGEPSPAPSE